MRLHPRTRTVPALALLLAATGVQAQVTLKPDGQWRYLLSAGANGASGNSRHLAVNATGEAARVTPTTKWTWTGQAAYGRNNGASTTNRVSLATQFNRDISARSYSFASADLLRDRPANLSHRYSAAYGFGRHLVRTESDTFDISLGLGYSQDRYVLRREVHGTERERYGRVEAVLAEESTHRLSQTASLRQRLTVFPNLSDQGNWRASFDTSVAVAITTRLNLTAGVNYRYDDDPGRGIKRGDLAFTTGLALRFD